RLIGRNRRRSLRRLFLGGSFRRRLGCRNRGLGLSRLLLNRQLRRRDVGRFFGRRGLGAFVRAVRLAGRSFSRRGRLVAVQGGLNRCVLLLGGHEDPNERRPSTLP